MLKPDCSQKTAKEYHLLLFVAGSEAKSRLARDYIVKICRNELCGRCTIDIVDVFEDILVTPTLMVCKPEPGAIIIGNLSDRDKVRSTLKLKKNNNRGLIDSEHLPDEFFDVQESRRLQDAGGKVDQESLAYALQRAGGKKTDAAKLLGISRRTLYRKLHKYGFFE